MSNPTPSFGTLTDPSGPLVVPADWMQGRTAFGGLQAAAALRALQAQVGDDRPVRSVSVGFVGPSGHEPLHMEPKLLRAGGTVTQARVDVVGSEGIAATVYGAFGKDRPSSVARPPTRFDVPEEVGGLQLPYLPSITPEFTQHFDIRWTQGQPPFGGFEGELAHEGWCRHRTDPGPSSAAALLGLLDAWPAPALQGLRGPAPASSVTWSAQLVKRPPVTTDDSFFFRARTLSAPGSAYVTMRGELYDRGGELVAHLEQLVTLYG